MKRTQLEELLTYKALRLKLGRQNTEVIDYLVDTDQVGNIPLKNVCTKVTQALADDLDTVCHTLEISKRRFVEAAIIEAMNQAQAIMDEVDVFEGQGEPA